MSSCDLKIVPVFAQFGFVLFVFYGLFVFFELLWDAKLRVTDMSANRLGSLFKVSKVALQVSQTHEVIGSLVALVRTGRRHDW
jgi:hypothetical protein